MPRANRVGHKALMVVVFPSACPSSLSSLPVLCLALSTGIL